MAEIKEINSVDESKVAGGAMIGGKQKVLLEESEIKKYEFRCKSCGHISHENDSWAATCPHCKAFFGYSNTGTALFDYDYANGANWRSYNGEDT